MRGIARGNVIRHCRAQCDWWVGKRGGSKCAAKTKLSSSGAQLRHYHLPLQSWRDRISWELVRCLQILGIVHWEEELVACAARIRNPAPASSGTKLSLIGSDRGPVTPYPGSRGGGVQHHSSFAERAKGTSYDAI